jgi:hypothetical protein
MKKIFLVLASLFGNSQSAISMNKKFIGKDAMTQIENAAHGSISNYDGEDFESNYEGDSEENYIGVGDIELENAESGFLGIGGSTTSNDVLSFTFRNENETNEEFYLTPGFKNVDRSGLQVRGTAYDGTFKSINNKDLICTGSDNCKMENLIGYINEYPTRVVGFSVVATATAPTTAPGQAVAQIKQMLLTVIRQSIRGNSSPSFIRPGLDVNGGQFNQNMTQSKANWQLDFCTNVKMNILSKTEYTIELYLGATHNSSVKLMRKHAIATRNLRG